MFQELFGKKPYKRIAPAEVKRRLDSNEKVLLIDVRTPEEYAEAHIPQSVSLPLNQLDRISEITDDKNTELILYCLSGGRAASACSRLAALGYSEVYNMGGIQSWNYQTVSGRR